MGITDAKKYVGKRCFVRWMDREGKELDTISMVHDVTYVPLYGGYLITDTEDIRLDKLLGVQLVEEMSAVPVAA